MLGTAATTAAKDGRPEEPAAVGTVAAGVDSTAGDAAGTGTGTGTEDDARFPRPRPRFLRRDAPGPEEDAGWVLIAAAAEGALGAAAALAAAGTLLDVAGVGDDCDAAAAAWGAVRAEDASKAMAFSFAKLMPLSVSRCF